MGIAQDIIQISQFFGCLNMFFTLKGKKFGVDIVHIRTIMLMGKKILILLEENNEVQYFKFKKCNY